MVKTNVVSRAVGRVARIVGLSVGISWVLLGSVGLLGAGAEPIDLISRPAPVFVLLPGILLAVRALMIGVRVDGTTLRIVSWWRTYRFTRNEVEELLIEHYSGTSTTGPTPTSWLGMSKSSGSPSPGGIDSFPRRP